MKTINLTRLEQLALIKFLPIIASIEVIAKDQGVSNLLKSIQTKLGDIPGEDQFREDAIKKNLVKTVLSGLKLPKNMSKNNLSILEEDIIIWMEKGWTVGECIEACKYHPAISPAKTEQEKHDQCKELSRITAEIHKQKFAKKAGN